MVEQKEVPEETRSLLGVGLPQADSDSRVEYGGIQTASRTIGKLVGALAKAQGEMGAAKKDSENPFFKSRYADLAAIREACREPLAKHGLAVVQTFIPPQNGMPMVLVTTLAHESGEWIESRWPVVPVKDDPQGLGSASTYARRYSLQAIVGVPAEDDDGEAASGRGKRQSTKTIEERGQEPQTSSKPTIPPEVLDEIMSVAKAQYSGRGISNKRVLAHLDALAREQGSPSLAQLDPAKADAVMQAIRSGGDPA